MSKLMVNDGQSGDRPQPPRSIGIDQVLSTIAAATPVPGGGSAGALAGALAAALGAMVAGLTINNKKFEKIAARARELHTQMVQSQRLLYSLSQEDAEAYQGVMDAFKLGQGSEQEKAHRSLAVDNAMRRATEVPLQTARTAFEVLDGLSALIEIGNPHARGDAATGAVLAAAVLKGAQYTVLVNIRGLKDREFAARCRLEVDTLAARSLQTVQHIDALMMGG